MGSDVQASLKVIFSKHILSSGQCKSSADNVINNVGGPRQRNVTKRLYNILRKYTTVPFIIFMNMYEFSNKSNYGHGGVPLGKAHFLA